MASVYCSFRLLITCYAVVHLFLILGKTLLVIALIFFKYSSFLKPATFYLYYLDGRDIDKFIQEYLVVNAFEGCLILRIKHCNSSVTSVCCHW